MTTSPDQRDKMRKPPSRRICRKLFADDLVEQAANDNFANILQESCRIDRDNMSKKWNFDFINEKPLEGPYEWYRRDEDSWIGMKPEPVSPRSDVFDKFIPIEKENQMTPRVPTGEAPPLAKKRKSVEVVNESRAKRKISFD